MSRNLLVVAKVCPKVDPELDLTLLRARHARTLLTLADYSGRGLLHCASWYDPWLTDEPYTPPDTWLEPLESCYIALELWELSLTEGDWPMVEQMAMDTSQPSRQRWLMWQLWEARQSYSAWNHRARLIIGREEFGQSLSDAEVLGEKAS